jgi:hypothetical protein
MEDINRERNNDQFDIETFFLFLIFSVVLEFEIRALHLPNKHSDSLSHAPQPFFALVIFQIGSPCLPGAGLASDRDPPE